MGPTFSGKSDMLERVRSLSLQGHRFEAFDEPWKVSLNTPGKEWEDKWGLMDPGRNLKPGLKIPDCGGKTVSR